MQSTDSYNKMRAELYMSQNPSVTFDQALEEVTKPLGLTMADGICDALFGRVARHNQPVQVLRRVQRPLSVLIIKTDEAREVPVTRNECPALFAAFEAWRATEERSSQEHHAWNIVVETAAEYLTEHANDLDDNVEDVLPA